MRASGAALTSADRQREATQQLEELASGIGRGAPALRNAAGHVLLLDPASQVPLLSPVGIDTSLVFTDETVEARDGTGENAVDYVARRFVAEGAESVGPAFEGPSSVIGGITTNGAGISAPGKPISTDGPTVGQGRVNSYTVTCAQLNYGVMTQGSDARWKSIEPDAGAELDAAAAELLAAPVHVWRWAWSPYPGPAAATAPVDVRRHASIVAQDAPALIRTERPEDGMLGVDDTNYRGVLLRALQLQAARIDALERRLEALEPPRV